MIRIITGAQNSSKHRKLFDYIKNEADKSKVLVIVPEQFTFEYEKRLYKTLGPREYNKLCVLSFKRLGAFLAQKYSVSVGNEDNDDIRMLAVYGAIDNLEKNNKLIHFSKSAQKPSFVKDCIDVIEQLRRNNIVPDNMHRSVDICNDIDVAHSKPAVSELSGIYLEYDNQLKKMGICDSLLLPQIACDILKEHNTFKGYSVYVDEFSGFSNDEFEIIKLLIRDADLTISLTMQNNNSKLSPTMICKNVQDKLVGVARDYNAQLLYDICDDYELCCSESVNHINKSLYSLHSESVTSDGKIRILNAVDRYKEIEACACQISHLVMEEGYRFEDIAVISNNLSDYDRICESVFYRYDIPYFTDFKQSVAQSVVVLHILNTLDAISTRSFRTEKILKYIKSPVSNISDVEKTMIEDYCISWNVDKDVWLSDFTGYVNSFGVDEAVKAEELERINSIRKKIIEPLQKLKAMCSDKSPQTICKALFEFFEETSLSQQIYSNTLRLADENNENLVEVSRNIKQIWLNITQTIRNIYDYCLVEKMTIKGFMNIARLLFSQLKIASTPQKLDSVILADAKHSRIGQKKVVFVLGVNEGVFPSNPHMNKLLDNSALSFLDKAGVEISDNQIQMLLKERYDVYNALTATTDRLYISYPTYDNAGGILHPSPVVKMVSKLVDKIEIESSNSFDKVWFCTNYKSTYYKYIEGFKENSAEQNTLKKLLLENPEYSDKIKFTEKLNQLSSKSISPDVSKKLFFRNNENTLITSASSIEKFFTCPYAYFFNKGIKLRKPMKHELDALNTGSLLHYCLEQIMSYEEDSKRIYNPEFVNYNDDALKMKISDLFIEYKEKGFGGDFAKTKLFDFRYQILKEYTFYIIKNLQLEISNSKFTPAYFEKSLNDDNGKFLFEKMFSDVLLRLSGSVDRVDIANLGDQKLLRVVDYKSGKKKFSPADVMYGLNMQMLLYLIAIINDEKLSSCVDSSILYQRIEPPYEFVDREKNSDEAKLSSDRSQLKAFGVGVDKFSSKDIQGDVSLESYSSAEFDNLKEMVNKKLEEYLMAMKDGEISPKPTMSKDSKESACEYCDYWSVCSAYNRLECKIVDKNDVEIFMDEISKMTGGVTADEVDR